MGMPKPRVLFGAGDIARIAHRYFTRDSECQVVALALRTFVGAGVPIMADTVEGGVCLPARPNLLERHSDEIDP
jgi:hypothetical protein